MFTCENKCIKLSHNQDRIICIQNIALRFTAWLVSFLFCIVCRFMSENPNNNFIENIVDMDLVGSILPSMEKPPSLETDINQKTISARVANEKSSFKCKICGKVFKKNKFYRHKLEHGKYKNNDFPLLNKRQKMQHNKIKNCFANGKPEIETTTFNKTCEICGNIYNDRIKFNMHKNNHKRDKKSNLHPFDKLGKIMHFKAYGLTAENAESTENSSPKVEASECVSSISASNMNGKLDTQNKHYKCPTCGRTFTKHSTYANHKRNHKINKKTGKYLYFNRSGEKTI